MVVIKWFLLSLIMTITACGQFDWFDKRQNFYTYDTVMTKSVTNIGYTFARTSSAFIRVKSSKSIGEASKKTPQVWTIWWETDTPEVKDSIQTKNVILTGLESGTSYSVNHSMFIFQNNGDTAYYYSIGTLFTTSSVPEGLLLATEDGNYVLTEDNNFIKFDEE